MCQIQAYAPTWAELVSCLSSGHDGLVHLNMVTIATLLHLLSTYYVTSSVLPFHSSLTLPCREMVVHILQGVTSDWKLRNRLLVRHPAGGRRGHCSFYVIFFKKIKPLDRGVTVILKAVHI